jgi:hypothetical protein
MLGSYDPLKLKLKYYTSLSDISLLLDSEKETLVGKKYMTMTKKLLEVVEDYSLISFTVCDAFKIDSLKRVLDLVDRANGFNFKAFTTLMKQEEENEVRFP